MTWTYKSMACSHSVWVHDPHTSAWLAGFPTIYTSAKGLYTSGSNSKNNRILINSFKKMCILRTI